LPSIVLRVRDPNGVLRSLTNREWWTRYRDHVLRTIELELPAFVSTFVANGNFFTSRTGNAVRSFRARAGTRNVVLWSVAEYLQYLNYGVRPHQMRYLLNAEVRDYLAFSLYPYRAAAPIPIKVGAGTIFRRATVKGMQEGKWMHPGLEPQNFMEKAIEAYLADFNSRHSDLVMEILE